MSKTDLKTGITFRNVMIAVAWGFMVTVIIWFDKSLLRYPEFIDDLRISRPAIVARSDVIIYIQLMFFWFIPLTPFLYLQILGITKYNASKSRLFPYILGFIVIVTVSGGVLENVWVNYILKSEGYSICRESANRGKKSVVIHAIDERKCQIYKEKFCKKSSDGKYKSCTFDRAHELAKMPALEDIF